MSGGRTLPLLGYGLATGLLEPLTPMVLRHRALKGKEDASRLDERLGRTPHERPSGPLAWLHGASVGEGLSLLPMVEAIAEARPDVAMVVTTGTRTSAELLSRRLPDAAIHQFAPVDAPGAVGRFLDHWRPDLAVFVESELWPNLLLGARDRGARLALLSAQLSASSASGWRRTPRSAKTILNAFDLILAKNKDAAAALTALGATVDGLADLKFGAPPLPADTEALAQAKAQIGARPMILAASTHAGEDEIILEAFGAVKDHPLAPLLVIVPRHPDRGLAIAALAWSLGASVTVRSAGEQPGAAAVYVADSLGELGVWYRLARLAILGGSLKLGLGGHNPLEAARLCCPFVTGPHVTNWSSVYDDLWRLVGGGPVTSRGALEDRIAAAVTDDQAARQTATQLRAYVEARDEAARGVPQRVLALLP